MNIKGQRIKIVPFSEGHINENYIQWLNDSEINLLLGREEYFNGFSVSDGINYLNEMKSNPEITFLSIINENNSFIGTAKTILRNPNHINLTSEIGIMIGDKSQWRKGYAKEAIFFISNYLFTHKHKKVVAGGFSNNIPMIKSFEAVGFIKEGRIRKKLMLKGEYYDHIQLGCFSDELKLSKNI